MDVNFSQDGYSTPIKTEPGASSMTLDAYPKQRGSRPTTAEPRTPRTPYEQRPIHSSLIGVSNNEPRYGSAAPTRGSLGPQGQADDQEDEEEEGHALEDEVYSAQQQAQLRAKANLKVLMDNFSEEQQTRYDWYRRSTLNKANVRKLIQSTGTLVTPQVAQMVAGVGKVFVGEIVERALEVQALRGEHGPLSPEHLRQAYQKYKEEKGNVGPARPLRGKRLAL